MTRPKFYTNDHDRKKALTKSKSKYMMNKQWFCSICNESNGNKNYTLAGKTCHLKTKKHLRNHEKYISNLKINITI